MQPSLGISLQEADLSDEGNLELVFIDGTVSRYAPCEDSKFAEALK